MSEEIKIYNDFDDMELNEKVLRGIYAYGFEKPSAIQQKAIRPIIDGNDVIGQAQSGTGKTATFSISMLNIIDPNENYIQGLILAPTRELANQIFNVINNLNQYLDLKIVVAIGGINIYNNIEEINNSPHIIIATPGRIIDIFTDIRSK